MTFDHIPLAPVPPPAESSDIPYVTHEGMLKLGDLEIRVLQLNTGQRVIPQEDMEKFLQALADTTPPEGKA